MLLAGLPEEELQSILAQVTWEAKTPRSIIDPVDYCRQLQRVRERGWALDDEEDLVNIRCVAAPVRDMQGHVIAAISAVGTVLDITPERIDELATTLCATAREISQHLGHTSP